MKAKPSEACPIPGHPHRRKRYVMVRVRKEKKFPQPAVLATLPPMGFDRPMTMAVGGSPMAPSKVSANQMILAPIFETLEIDDDKQAELMTVNFLKMKDESEWKEEQDGEKALIAASFRQLVYAITNPDYQNSNVEFQRQFLITFPSFATPYEVFSALLIRYFADFNDPDCSIKSSQALKQVRDRVVRILSTWVKVAPYQFDDKLQKGFSQFINYLVSNSPNALQAQILEASLAQIKGKGNKVQVTQKEKILSHLPFPNKPLSQWTLLDIDPEEIARQVTLYHAEVFLQLNQMELLTAIWGTKKGGGSQHVDELTHHFDFFSRYISLTIIEGATPSIRGKIMQHWIKVAIEFNKLKNYHGLFTVVCALTHVSITRLADTQKQALKLPGVIKKQWMELVTLCDFTGDYKSYRPIIESATNPCIPFIGCFQKDLIYVQEGFPNKVDGLINFKKCIACSKLLKVVEKFVPHYFLEEVPRIQELLRNIPEPPDTTDLMKMSISKEKRKKK